MIFNPFGSVPVTLSCVIVPILGLLLAVQEAAPAEVPQEAPASAVATASETPATETPATGAPAAENSASQTTSADGKTPVDAAKDPKAEPSQPWMQFLPFAVIGLFFYFILLRPQQAEQRRRKELLTSLKKNDKVVTTSGLIGTIADISSDGTRVTLKVDDNTRIKFLRSAIQEPLKDGIESNGSGSA